MNTLTAKRNVHQLIFISVVLIGSWFSSLGPVSDRSSVEGAVAIANARADNPLLRQMEYRLQRTVLSRLKTRKA